MSKQKPPLNVLRLIAKARESKQKRAKPRLIPEATLMNRIKKRKK